MKKSRILLFITALLVLATLLSACRGKGAAQLTDYLNADYDLTDDVYATVKSLPELEGYEVMYTVADEIVVLQNTNENDGKITISYKLLSMISGSVVKEFIANEDTRYSFESQNSAVLVHKTALDASTIDMEYTGTDNEIHRLISAVFSFRSGYGTDSILEDYITETYSLYDITGAEIVTTKYKAEVKTFADLVVYDDVAYSVNEKTGAWTKVAEIPEYMALNYCLHYTDDYYYAAQGDNAITLYDKTLKAVHTFVLPEQEDESLVYLTQLDLAEGFSFLNNGDLLLQYALVLDEDAKKYDFSWVEDGVTNKMDLVTVLFSAETGKVKELDLDYVIEALVANDRLYDDKLEANENEYNQEFENIAIVAPIEDGKVLTTEDKKDIVFMDNDVEIGASLKIVDRQANELAEKIATDLYAVPLLDGGVALLNGEGEVVNTLNSQMEIRGAYFVGEDAIYDLSLNKVQDLKDPDVSIRFLDDTIFVTTHTSSKDYTIVALRDGTSKTVYTHTKDSKDRFVIGSGYYYIVDEAANYKYFNEKGNELITTKRPLSVAVSSYENGTMLVKGEPVDAGEKVVYYVFTK